MSEIIIRGAEKPDLRLDNKGQAVPAAVSVLYDGIVSTLDKHYPDWTGCWYITIDTHGGIVQVRNIALSGRMGFQLPITQIDPEYRVIWRMAGELLERYRIARQRGLDIVDAVKNMKRDYRGEAEHDE